LGLVLRLLYLIWLIGFVTLASVATSQLIFGRSSAPVQRWFTQLSNSLLWPLALFTQSGRQALSDSFSR